MESDGAGAVKKDEAPTTLGASTHSTSAMTGLMRYYGTNEELGAAHFLSAFAGDSVGLARTALVDTTPSDVATFWLHDALSALLQAYLPPREAKMWRDACDYFVFLQGFSQGWTALVRLLTFVTTSCFKTCYCGKGWKRPEGECLVGQWLKWRPRERSRGRLLLGASC